eukprot:TRINITY_DN18588_c0_g1_i1.p1 TRINITY_DN18588_c0_g1~~TRINITY_DN18588_c0_g1_i1.p1  ORF type:complete len:224 (+),score=32.49 TRINITY_DN18588_c0_g1_i1:222-893(+)
MSSESGIASSFEAKKKMIKIDVTIDTICPWCFIGKKKLDMAINATSHLYDFQVVWHPYMLNPHLSKEGVNRKDFLTQNFGSRALAMSDTVDQVFQTLGFRHKADGIIGNSLDSHRLIYYAHSQGLDKQNIVVESLLIQNLVDGKNIADREVLLTSAEQAGVQGVEECLDNPNFGLKETLSKIKTASSKISGVPFFEINDKYEVSGAQDPDFFINIFKKATNEE